MQIDNRSGLNTGALIIVKSIAAWAAIYDLSAASFRMQVRSPDASGGEIKLSASTADGRITYEPTTHLLTIHVSQRDIAHIVGAYPYDVRVEGLAEPIPLFGGTITFEQGVTR